MTRFKWASPSKKSPCLNVSKDVGLGRGMESEVSGRVCGWVGIVDT